MAHGRASTGSRRAEPLAYVKHPRAARALSEAARTGVAELRDSAPRAANAHSPHRYNWQSPVIYCMEQATRAARHLRPGRIALWGSLRGTDDRRIPASSALRTLRGPVLLADLLEPHVRHAPGRRRQRRSPGPPGLRSLGTHHRGRQRLTPAAFQAALAALPPSAVLKSASIRLQAFSACSSL